MPPNTRAALSFESDVLDRLARIEANIERLLLAHQSQVDDRHIERVAVIGDSTKGRHFTSVELLEHAKADPDPALRTMLDSALIATPKECGRFLRRLERQSRTDPIRLVRAGDCRDGLLWAVQVSRVMNPPNPRG